MTDDSEEAEEKYNFSWLLQHKKSIVRLSAISKLRASFNQCARGEVLPDQTKLLI